MKELHLHGGYIAKVDDEDYERLSQYKWYIHKKKNTSYATRRAGKFELGNTITLHRDVLQLRDKGIRIDHVDFDGLNNQKANLRPCTHAENIRNRRKSPSATGSNFKGVYPSKNRWCAAIGYENRSIYLGCFLTQIDAADAYNAAAKRLHKEFAHFNDTGNPVGEWDNPPLWLRHRECNLLTDKDAGRLIVEMFYDDLKKGKIKITPDVWIPVDNPTT